jgi:putative Mg2+ transporter-C (MgtC) family protein
MEIWHFTLHIGVALLLGAFIGLERQFRQHPAGLRTNALVSVGAALFVSLTPLLNNHAADPTRIASYVVSGVGFLGGGVILREGMNVRGMATAATLWCSAAIGTLAGAGLLWHALLGTLVIVTLHLTLRPVALWIDARRRIAVNIEVGYRVRVVCERQHESLIRTILARHINIHPSMTLQGISIQDCERPEQTTVVADIFAMRRNDRELEDLMSRLNIEPSVSAVRWETVR